MEFVGFEVVAIIAVGLGAAVWLTDHKNPASLALGLFLVALGLNIVASVYARGYGAACTFPIWAHGLGFIDAAGFFAGTEWGLRVGRTIGSVVVVRWGQILIRSAQLLILGYAVLVATAPGLRACDLAGALSPGAEFSQEFQIVAAIWTVATVLVLVAGGMLLRRRPDKAEAARITTMMALMPLFAVSLALPDEIAPHVIALGEVIFLIGALRYHNLQGARGLFMAQFLAPQVAAMVRQKGMRNAMAKQRLELSVVCCDIRNFSRYSDAHEPEDVLRLLRDFYASVGSATGHVGGTIKDMAGDGVLILIGAPLAYADHAQRALKLARQLQRQTRPVLHTHDPRLGLGVGVASGSVVVGIVGERARYEYAAIGPAVNLASRLCDLAKDGDIYTDEAVWEAGGRPAVERERRRRIKGFADAVMTYRLGRDPAVGEFD